MLSQRPERSAVVPASVLICFRVFVGIAIAASGVVKGVAHDAVMLGIKAGDEGEVIGECDGGIGRKHTVWGGCARAREFGDVRSAPLLRIVVAEAVERDENDIVLFLLLVRVERSACFNNFAAVAFGRDRSRVLRDGGEESREEARFEDQISNGQTVLPGCLTVLNYGGLVVGRMAEDGLELC